MPESIGARLRAWQADLEPFISGWYYDEASHEMSRQIAAFMLEFLQDQQERGASERTLRKHTANCSLIGSLVLNYGYHESFSPDIFLGAPAHLYEFKRKVSSSRYAVDSYQSTWRALGRYRPLVGL